MFKVSYKDFMKVQTFNDRATIVTMVGKLSMPDEVWDGMPNKIADWMWHHPSIDVQWGTGTKDVQEFRVEFSGKSTCSNDDTFNAETDRRIAESRAKVRLYRFMANLCNQLATHYIALLYGHGVKSTGADAINDGIIKDLKKYQELCIKESYHLGKLLEEA